MKRFFVFSALAVVLTISHQSLGQGGRGGPPEAPGLEVAHQRLLQLFELAGVVYTDADENTGRLVVGVLDRDIEPSVRGMINGLGVPQQSIDVIETEAIVPVATLNEYVRPVQGGLQIRFGGYVCSVSYPALRGGVLGFVTAAHCSTTQGAVDGTLYYQPANQIPSELVAQETVDPAFFKNANGCPRGRKCRYSDANFSELRSPGSVALGQIARTSGPNNNNFNVVGQFNIVGEANGTVGQPANKVGRTTAWTRGNISNVCANTGVSGTNIVLLCQSFVQSSGSVIVAGGDSGSPVFGNPDANNNVTLLGTLWGSGNSGRTIVYSPISAVKSEIGGGLVTR